MTDKTPQDAPAQPAAPQVPALTALLQATFPGAVLQHHCQHGDETVVLSRDKLAEVCAFLKNDARCRFEMMIDLTAADYLPRQPRFEVVYHLKSLTHGHRLRLKVPLEEQDAHVASIQGLWVAANWYERECAEMYGIDFVGHPNLSKLLLYEGFEGYPLRKDYEKGRMQPLVPMRPVKERYSYGEHFTETRVRSDAPNADLLQELAEQRRAAGVAAGDARDEILIP